MDPRTFSRMLLAAVVIFTLNHTTAISLAQQSGQVAVGGLTTGYYSNPVGIDSPVPKFSWLIKSELQNTRQTAWQIRSATSMERLQNGTNIIWDSERVESTSSVHNHWDGPPLESSTRYYWQVRIWDNHGRVSPWSDIAYFETGLLSSSEWEASWIEPGFDEDYTESQPAPMVRSEFEAGRGIASARAYVTAHGVYEMHINGQRVGEELFTPGWTSYHNRLQYQTYDITGYLEEGQNAVGVYLGDGWFRGYMGWGDQRNYYGETLALLAQIVITHDDGSKTVFGTGSDWKSSTGPILRSDIYNGEYYDARLEKEGWTMPGYDDSNWHEVITASHNKTKLIAQQAPPVLKIQEISPVDIFTTPEGDLVADLGQNMIGWIRLRVRGPAGTRVTLRHAEVLDRHGNFYTDNLRAADQTNTYVLKGGGVEIWEPRFTFQGFRYVAIDGYPGRLSAGDLTGVVIHSEMEPTGHFQSSHPLVNQLQHNIVWGQKGNFLEVPTDCPQRDERMGWTGDIQVFAPTANINMNTAGFLTKWLGDLAAEQNEAGSVPFVVPNVLGDEAYGSAGWGDAALIVPWSLYNYFGDKAILAEQYESMKSWVEFMRRRAATNDKPYLWDTDFSFGDWLSYSTASDAHYPGAYTDYRMIATMFFAHSTDLLRRSAEVLGKDEDAVSYGKLFEKIREAFQHEYVTPAGRVMSDTQTAYLLALAFNLLPEDNKPAAVNSLVTDIRSRQHLTTGFLGTPHLNPVLSRYQHHETAYDLLLRESYPSWLYPVTMGATTIWERWDGIKPDGTFQDEGMNSFNHYAYGAIGQWLFETVAGISPEPGSGYRSSLISPLPGGGLDHARAMIRTMYGNIESAWDLDGEKFTLHVEVPPNTQSTVILPWSTAERVGGSAAERASNPGILEMMQQGDNTMVLLGSGKYTFSYTSEDLARQAGNMEPQPLPVFNERNTIGELLAVKQSRDILYRHLPVLTTSPWLSQVMGFTLKQARQNLPPRLSYPESVLDEIQQELLKLSE